MGNLLEVFKNDDVRKLPQYCTPIGKAVVCFLTKPSTEFKIDGEYIVKLKFDAGKPEVKKLLKIIDKATDDAFNRAMEAAETPKERKALERAVEYTMEEDDDGVETGYVLINFKRNAWRVTKDKEKKPVRLPLFDAGQTPLDPDEIELWGGTEVVVAFKLKPWIRKDKNYIIGTSHRIEAIQVIKAVAGGDNRTADSFGFSKVAGFTGAEVDEDADDDGEGEFSNTALDADDDF